MFTIRIKSLETPETPRQEHVFAADHFRFAETDHGPELTIFDKPNSGPGQSFRACYCDEIIVENAAGKTVDFLSSSREVPAPNASDAHDGTEPLSPDQVRIWRRGGGSRTFNLPPPDVVAA